MDALVLDEAMDHLDAEGLEGRFVMTGGALGFVTADESVIEAKLVVLRGRPPTLLRAALAAPGRKVADLTAGLGTDAFTLASAGCQVTAFERSTIPWLLLRDALRRAAADPATAGAASRVTLVRGDARHIVPCLLPFEVVTLDPMFAVLKPKAGKRKAMDAFQGIVGRDEDASELLSVAIAAATRRVSVKRQTKAPRLEGPVPSGVIKGRTIRFDVYAGSAAVDAGQEEQAG